MFDFLHKLFDHLLLDNHMWSRVLKNQQTILDNQKLILFGQKEIKEILMGVKQTVEEYAAKVNGFSNDLAAAIATITQQIADLNARLVDASTPEEVAALLATPLANLEAVKNAAVALAAGNQPTVPDTPPPVEPLPEEPPL